MGYRKTSLINNEFYHIYNRGNSKQKIFFDNKDYDRFIKLLYICNSIKQISFRDDIVEKKIDAWDFDREETIVSIGAWVLMPNHFHIYITFPEDRLQGENNITIFMRKLCTSYSKYFNTKYKRTGGLFESRFKSVHIENDNQAKYLFSYIHLNPIKLIDSKWKENGIQNKKQTKDFLNEYLWSSYLDYKKVIRPQNKILDKKIFPKYFQNIKDFDSEIEEWITFLDPENLGKK